ncbi:MAG: ATP-binding protein [Syntrophales bacterium]
MLSPLSVSTDCSASAQAAQLIPLHSVRDYRLSDMPFLDNLDYLEALEQEAKLVLARGLLRRSGPAWQSNPQYVRAISLTGLSQDEATLEKLNELLVAMEQRNGSRLEASDRAGVNIFFPKFCSDHDVDSFNRIVLMLLLMFATSKAFAEMFGLCDFEKVQEKSEGLKIGSVLAIICRDYREQLTCRRHFSVDAPLMQEEILYVPSYFNETSNILDETVCLYDRYVRFFLGDNNFYNNSLRFIRCEKGSVSLEQVIISEEIKSELVSRIESFFASREKCQAAKLDDFFGYGTALTLLFYGPSGTGKTMMAQALSCHLNRPLFSLKWGNIEERRWDFEDIIKHLFREASLNGGIVFFDEADDLFEDNSGITRSLLIEIEKAHCVVILATNKPVDLDPAMDRRLAIKVYFRLPDVELRYRMWKALMPDFIKLAPDVDLRKLAERYLFTGGLIKNCLFMAINASLMNGNNGNSVVTREMIEQAVDLQSQQMVDMSHLCRIYTPNRKLADLQIKLRQREAIGNVAKTYQRLQGKKLGLNILITTTDPQTGIDVVGALAHECSLKVREFDYRVVSSRNVDAMVVDAVSQKKVFPMDYAFAAGTGDASMILFVDYDGLAKWASDRKEKDDNPRVDPRMLNVDLLSRLRFHQGLFCIVTQMPLKGMLPAEFNLHFNLEYPPEETQLRRWEEHMDKATIDEDELIALVEQNPMHVTEIDFIARQALIQSLIQSKTGVPTIEGIRNVIAGYRPKHFVPLLFGRNEDSRRRGMTGI